MVCESNNCQLSEFVSNLPPELCEIIYKKFLAIKLRQRAALGWNEVQEALKEAPFCEKQNESEMFCFVGNVTLAVRMGSVTRVTKMEFITISAILCLTFTTTTKSFRNTGKKRLSTSL